MYVCMVMYGDESMAMYGNYSSLFHTMYVYSKSVNNVCMYYDL